MLPKEVKSITLLETKPSKTDPLPTNPVPTNLEEYLPWACYQWSMTSSVAIEVKRVLPSIKLKKRRLKPMVSTATTPNTTDSQSQLAQVPELPTLPQIPAETPLPVTSELLRLDSHHEDAIVITAVYDNQDKLTQLKLSGKDKNPRILFQVLGHILPYHPHLTSIEVKPPLDKHLAYEMGKILPNSNLSDITLDDCFLREANFYLLLEGNVSLKRLSLARCGITDRALQEITTRLIHTHASKFLSVLNLTSNRITDIGAQYISEMLRSNRKLCYLNLAGNSITDIGAKMIFDALMEFEMTASEKHYYISRYMEHVKQKLKPIEHVEYKPEMKRKSGKIKLNKKQSQTQSLTGQTKSVSIQTKSLPSKVCMSAMLKEAVTNPFHSWTLKHDKVYNTGNQYLQCLNLAYNQMSFNILDKIIQVLSYQRQLNKNPLGLIKLCLDGNLMPVDCMEYMQIEEFISDAITWQSALKDNKKKTAFVTK